jgi:ubiquinone/menaquinone biosynthesis C-methylase UbiE
MDLEGNFCQANAEELPFKTETFDCVCSMGVLHHTPTTAKAINEIFRVLKPGGRLIVMFYHRNSWLYRVTFPWVSIITGQSRQQLVNEVDGIGNPKGHVYSKTEMQELLFQFEKVELFVGLLQKWMLLPKIGHFLPIPKSLLQRFEQRWGWFLYAKAIKPWALSKMTHEIKNK